MCTSHDEFVESVIIDSIFADSARDDRVNYVMRLYLYTDTRACNSSARFFRSVETKSICVCSVRTTWVNSTLLWITEKTEETFSKSSNGFLMVKGSKIAYGRGLFVLQRLCVMVLIWALLSALEFCFQSWWGTLMPQEGEQVCWWEICFEKLWVN